MNYQMSSVDEQTFKESVAKQTGMDQAMLDNMSIEQIGESMGVPLTSFEKEVEDDDGNTVVTNCVDMRTIFAAMEASGAMTEEQILSMRDTVSDTIDTMGSSLVKSMGIAYAVSCDTAAGVDIDKVQTSYLWSAGGRMVAMALLMGVATVLVGFFGARIGAGIGRDLRGKIFGQVVRFSNAEMDHFSTASLITRRYPADPDGFRRDDPYGCLCADSWHRRCIKNHPDRSRNGMDHYSGNPCDPWLCHGINVCYNASF